MSILIHAMLVAGIVLFFAARWMYNNTWSEDEMKIAERVGVGGIILTVVALCFETYLFLG